MIDDLAVKNVEDKLSELNARYIAILEEYNELLQVVNHYYMTSTESATQYLN